MYSAGQGSHCQTPSFVLTALDVSGHSLHIFCRPPCPSRSRPPSPSRSTSARFVAQAHSFVTVFSPCVYCRPVGVATPVPGSWLHCMQARPSLVGASPAPHGTQLQTPEDSCSLPPSHWHERPLGSGRWPVGQ